uniref:Uncharacterized protein n=1 Tax=Solanum lycopersicum TaxID=4081 RepID=A0A3Q7FR23_SOLLC
MPTYRCPMNCTKEWKKLPINERADSNLNTIICCVMRLRSSLSNQIGKIHGKEILEVGWLLVMRQPGCPDGKVSVKQDLLYSLNGFFHCSIELVKVLFLILMDLCRRTAGLVHPLPVSQVGSNNIQVRLHYIDGNYTVLPEVVEASLGPHMQNMPRPRGADAAGLLLRELELHPPAEEWHRRNMFGGPWSDPEDVDDNSKLSPSRDLTQYSSLENCDVYYGAHGLWPRKRRMSERDAAFGLNTSVGLGAYLGIMGSRRDVVTAVWKTGLEGVWYKCIRCLRQTSAFASPGGNPSANQHEKEVWWISRWACGCPMCGGTWKWFSTWRQTPLTLPAYCGFVTLVMYYTLKISVSSEAGPEVG